jgi:hypothetical protein
MASTYSQLKIELIGTGDQAGTWGTTTNVNLGTALEEAITGSANVTFASSNVALTLADTNATQVARNLELNLVGTITNQQTLFIPAIEKQYIVVNGLSNAVVISNGTNAAPTGTTVAVPAGRSMTIFNDSINVAETTTYITEFRASNVTVTNNVNAASVNLTNALTVANGGTGRANLTLGSVVVGNNTGTVTMVAPGTANNVLTSNGTHWVSLAPTSTGNFAPATSGTAILRGNGSGGFANIVVGSGLTLTGNTLTANVTSATSLGLVRAVAINCILP